jgi:hypothetical protein
MVPQKAAVAFEEDLQVSARTLMQLRYAEMDTWNAKLIDGLG